MRNFSTSSVARLASLILLFVFPFISAHPASKNARALERDHLVFERAAAASCSTPPQLCSSCGGEDPQKKGYCLKKADGATSACACVPDTQVITTVVSGKTATGTYSATEFTEFASISGTTTVSKTVTQNGHETEIAIAVAGAGAGAGIIGGVAWWLATTSGDEAAANTLSDSVDTDSEDDEPEDNCQGSEPNCSDCGGADSAGNCKSGDHKGCPCKPPECPTGVICVKDNCQGKNGLCTKDPIKDCPCCPNQPDLCDGDCKGSQNKCTAGSSKDCKCYGELDASWPSLYWMVPPDAGVTSAWESDILKTQYGNKLSNIPFNSYFGRPGDISCSTPPLPDGWDPNKIKELVQQFCKDFDPNKDKSEKYTDDGTGICTSQVTLSFTHGLSGACSKSCEDTFADMISECSNPTTHLFDAGATFKPPCGTFTLSGVMPDYTGVSLEHCYSGSDLPLNGLNQPWDPARIDAVIDFVCSKKFDLTAKGACSLGETKQGLIAKKTDPLVFAYAHYPGETGTPGSPDYCPPSGTQFSDQGYIHQDTFQADCLRAFRNIVDKCPVNDNCGQTLGGTSRLNCVDYELFTATLENPPDDAKKCKARLG